MLVEVSFKALYGLGQTCPRNHQLSHETTQAPREALLQAPPPSEIRYVLTQNCAGRLFLVSTRAGGEEELEHKLLSQADPVFLILSLNRLEDNQDQRHSWEVLSSCAMLYSGFCPQHYSLNLQGTCAQPAWHFASIVILWPRPACRMGEDSEGLQGWVQVLPGSGC